MSTHLRYRPEIDGLRAIAVIPVILFHAGFEYCSGGYVGVDIFFVISGFLITSILVREISTGQLSISQFYRRRAIRLLPALVFVILCCLPIAWFLLMPEELITFGKSILSVTTFTSNIYFWSIQDYFAPSAELQPLLHTWSLAVEEQFYILFPIYLLIAWRFGFSKFFTLTAIVALISLCLSEWAWRNTPAANFYLLPTRAWELLIGSLLALYTTNKRQRISNIGSSIGLLFICIALFVFDKSTPFPSIYTLVPIIGTVLIILYSTPETIVGKLLSSKIFVGIGLISYSAYLWHQPLLAFLKIASLESVDPIHNILAVIMTFVLAYLTYRYIETPFRKNGFKKTTMVTLSLSFTALGICFLIGFIIIKNEGFTPRLHEQYSAELWDTKLSANHGLDQECEFTSDFTEKTPCIYGHNVNTLLWGDSFAMHLAQSLIQADVNFIQATRSVCGPSFFDSPLNKKRGYNMAWSSNCYQFNQSVLKYIENNEEIEFVILASPFGQYLENEFYNAKTGIYVPTPEQRKTTFINTLQKLKSLGVTPILVIPPPQTGINIGSCLKRRYSGLFVLKGIDADTCSFDMNRQSANSKKARLFAENIASLTDTKFIDLGSYICFSDNLCSAEIDGTPIYRDTGHLSKSGSALLSEKFDLYADLSSYKSIDRQD